MEGGGIYAQNATVVPHRQLDHRAPDKWKFWNGKTIGEIFESTMSRKNVRCFNTDERGKEHKREEEDETYSQNDYDKNCSDGSDDDEFHGCGDEGNGDDGWKYVCRERLAQFNNTDVAVDLRPLSSWEKLANTITNTSTTKTDDTIAILMVCYTCYVIHLS